MDWIGMGWIGSTSKWTQIQVRIPTISTNDRQTDMRNEGLNTDKDRRQQLKFTCCSCSDHGTANKNGSEKIKETQTLLLSWQCCTVFLLIQINCHPPVSAPGPSCNSHSVSKRKNINTLQLTFSTVLMRVSV